MGAREEEAFQNLKSEFQLIVCLGIFCDSIRVEFTKKKKEDHFMKYTGRISFMSISISFSLVQTLLLGETIPREIIDGLLALVIAWFIGWQYDKMSFYANHDYLTELFNRRLALKKFTKLKEKSAWIHSPLAVFMLDVNNFKELNDRFGHETGDYALKKLAVLLLNHTQKSDVVARWGGDEFVILSLGVTHEQAEHLIEKLEEEILEQIHQAKAPLKIGISIGYAFYPEEGHSLEELLHVADQKMYRVKAQKKTTSVQQKRFSPHTQKPE
ncbi:GGDEF domain-containing protein [Bacillus badius]|uniref:GGDEF domain-containing protein n=1 Tax=Bacillus badius TaxID=1455 RepID=UPI002E1F2F8C|nr:GGDEF domain-containing protein [Bacillus badius]